MALRGTPGGETQRRLSKTRYQWGLQCPKRLWLDANRREHATPPDPDLRSRLAFGHKVGDLARRLWADSVLVREPAARHERAEKTTRSLMANPNVAAICEGAFSFEAIRVRVDVLVRTGRNPGNHGNPGIFDLIEVKSSSRVKPEHYTDAGVQLRVLEGSGVDVDRVAIVHLDSDYGWTGASDEPYDLDRVFRREDVTAQARVAAAAVDANAQRLRGVLSSDDAPAIDVGKHCREPYVCPFLAYCDR